jgi:dihydrofolate reductase
MGKVKYGVSVSLDGFAAGPRQSVEHPLGVRGELLHEWMRELAAWREQAGLEGGIENESTERIEHEGDRTGALIMGRNMFGGGPGPWAEEPTPWNGWWGDEPPFHLPVFVLTHHPRPPLELAGGTSFTFVQDGIEAALELARGAAGERDVTITGGATTARQYLAAGLVDVLTISLVPVLLGEGVRLFDDAGLAGTRLEQVRVQKAPGVTHLDYRVCRPSF